MAISDPGILTAGSSPAKASWFNTTRLNVIDLDSRLAAIASGGVLLTADPASPADDTWWVVRTGTTPTMTVALKARISGVTYTIASITL